MKCLYRRDRANMPGSQREVANAEEEGVEFVWLTAPARLRRRGQVDGRRWSSGCALARRTRPGGRRRRIIEDADYTEPADLVIKALGFEPEDLPKLWGVAGAGGDALGHDQGGLPRPSRRASKGVYAVGDIVRGASLVVWAIRDGREAAESHPRLRLAGRAAWRRSSPKRAYGTRTDAVWKAYGSSGGKVRTARAAALTRPVKEG